MFLGYQHTHLDREGESDGNLLDRQDDLEGSVVDIKSEFSVFLDGRIKASPHHLFLPKAILTLTNLRVLFCLPSHSPLLQGYSSGQPILAADHYRIPRIQISRHARLQRKAASRKHHGQSELINTPRYRPTPRASWALLPPSLQTLPREDHSEPFLDTTPGALSI